MRDFKDIIKDIGNTQYIQQGADGFRLITLRNDTPISVIVSKGAGWEHASFAPLEENSILSWEDMCYFKDMIWNSDEAVIQIHPPKDEYVNNKNNCLHLWRCYYKDMTLPPSVLVGVRKGQTEKEFMKELKEAYESVGEVSPV